MRTGRPVTLELVGQRFGRLVVVGRGSRYKAHILWLCQCDCGKPHEVIGINLKRGSTTSCGCYRSEFQSRVAKAKFTRHGHAREVGAKQSPEHRAWVDMRSRCSNPKLKAYPYYGGRGIKVCDRWDAYENFLADMGPRPSAKHTLDRKDANGDYTPDNCRWATWDVQMHNRRALSNTGVLGVTWNEQRQRFCWAIKRNGVGRRGRATTLVEAEAAVKQAQLELYGEHT